MALGNQEVGGGECDENAVSLGALAKGISPFFALVSLKDEKGHLLLFSYWEDEWDNASQAPNTGQKKKRCCENAKLYCYWTVSPVGMSHLLQSHRNNSKCDEGSGAARSKDSALNGAENSSFVQRTRGRGCNVKALKKNTMKQCTFLWTGSCKPTGNSNSGFAIFHHNPGRNNLCSFTSPSRPQWNGDDRSSNGNVGI